MLRVLPDSDQEKMSMLEKSAAVRKSSGIFFGVLLDSRSYKITLTRKRPKQGQFNEVLTVKLQKSNYKAYYLKASVPVGSKIRSLLREYNLGHPGVSVHHVVACCSGYGDKLRFDVDLHHLNCNSFDDRAINLAFVPSGLHKKFHHKISRKNQLEDIGMGGVDAFINLDKTYFLNITFKFYELEWNNGLNSLAGKYNILGNRSDKALAMAELMMEIRKLGSTDIRASQMIQAAKVQGRSVRTAKTLINSLVSAGDLFKTSHGRYVVMPGG